MVSKYPAKEHARRAFAHFLEKLPEESQSAFFISGENYELWPYCDQSKPIRQNRYFYYITGCNIPGSHVFYDGGNDKLTLYLPDVDEEDIMWSGLPVSRDEAAAKYDVDEVKFAHEVLADLKAFSYKIYTTDVNQWNKNFESHLIEKDYAFFHGLDEARLIKDDYEIALMRHAAKITDMCHHGVMLATAIETNETHIHAEFMYHALREGSKYQSYDPICCSGPNCSTLHYVKNDDEIPETKHSILIDAGAEWECYASDVTRCFPINGDWTVEHLNIYRAVLRMQQVTMSMIRPGALWDDIHLRAHEILIEEFLKLGIFKSKYSKQEIYESRISARFFPHGLGHLLGMDTHDVGGRPNYEDPDPYLQYLRLRRKLQKGMVLTDEPGIYFSPFLLEDVLKDEKKAKYIDHNVLDKYWYVGGVRIEDDLVITANGFENLTGITSDPAEISEIVKKGLNKNKKCCKLGAKTVTAAVAVFVAGYLFRAWRR